MPNTIAFLIVMVLWFLILRPLIGWVVRPLEQTEPVSALFLYLLLGGLSVCVLTYVGLQLTVMLGG